MLVKSPRIHPMVNHRIVFLRVTLVVSHASSCQDTDENMTNPLARSTSEQIFGHS
uniref:Uncharacterized protein n=1 Tax=Parascaris equorum TaxID=6256 RepID=A0A914RJX4_PAREQ